MANYLLAGGSGFVGSLLSEMLVSKGHMVYILSTKKRTSIHSNIQFVLWDTKNNLIDKSFSLMECYIINLAGAGVADKRWTKARKKQIIDSRLDSLNTIYTAVEQGQLKPIQMVSASAIGYYGEGDKEFTELDPSDESFLSSTCKSWEDAALKFSDFKIPIAIVRIGIVMGIEGGALKEFLKPLKFGIAGIPSDGKQIYSWIHRADLCSMICFLAEKNMNGIYNAVAPNPSTLNEIFDEILKLKKGIRIHAPAFAIKILLGEMAIEILKSSKVSSHKIESEGFSYKYPTINTCIQSLLNG